ncbi:unannotated protein [freshwater metagenome]|uniref:Unannotated protein n=1 Tax=freshwater metagenome TaxID=449393 RepID=A0A6J7C682_9ZZZZ
MHGRPAATGAGGDDTLDEFGGLQRLEVLANRSVGETELGGQFRRSCCVGALEPLDDAALGTGQIGSDGGDAWEPSDYESDYFVKGYGRERALALTKCQT